MVNKRVRNAVLGSNLKNDRMISVSKAPRACGRPAAAELERPSEETFPPRLLGFKPRKSAPVCLILFGWSRYLAVPSAG